MPACHRHDIDPGADRTDFINTLRTARIKLTKEGYYDKTMLNLLKRVSCKSYPEDSECAEGDE